MPEPSSRQPMPAASADADVARLAPAASGWLVAMLFLAASFLAGCAADREIAVLPPPVPAAAQQPAVMQLVGIDAEVLRRQFGKPGLIWREEPAQVWQYRGPACVLNVFLYRDNGRLVVSDAEAHSKDATDDPVPPCVSSLLDARRAKLPS
jgi:hypothetical protein